MRHAFAQAGRFQGHVRRELPSDRALYVGAEAKSCKAGAVGTMQGECKGGKLLQSFAYRVEV